MLQFSWRRAAPAILIISDNPLEPLYESPFLSQSNLRLMLAPANSSCLETARRVQPTLIIEELAASDDLELCKRLRSDPKTCSIPLILITSGQTAEQVNEVHPNEQLARPLTRRAFFDAVRRYVPLPHRKTVRVIANLRFTYRLGDRTGQAFSRDLSCHGAFLKSDCLPPLGSRLDLVFRIPGSWDEIRCDAVVRSHSGDPGPRRCRGFGIEFGNLGDEDVDRLQAFIEHYRTPALLSI